MKILFAIIAITLVATAIAVVWYRSRRQNTGSFWDVLRNPESLTDPKEYHRQLDAIAVELAGSPAEIANLVDYVVFEAESADAAWAEFRILERLGSAAYPRALEILRDPAMKAPLTRLTERKNSLPEAPINRLCNIFQEDAAPPLEAAKLLAPYIQSESDEIRKSAAYVIGLVGSEESIEDLRRALSDNDEYVKSYTLRGISQAISKDHIEPTSKNTFFELVAGMWPQDQSFNGCHQIPQILLQLDRPRAEARLLSSDLFTVRFKPIWRILEAMHEESVTVPRERILALIDEASQEPHQHANNRIVATALVCLGEHHHEQDLQMLEQFFNHTDDKISAGAVEGLYRFHRYQETIREPWEIVKRNGWNVLTTPEKHLCAIEELNNEVNNGGFAQYYFNSSGDQWQDAQAGLAAIGAIKRHQLMTATLDKFGDQKPSEERSARMEQLSKIVQKKEDPFKEQDDAWYEAKEENLDRLMFKYNLANLQGREKAATSNKREPDRKPRSN